MNPVLLAVVGIIAVMMTGMASYILMPVEDDIHTQNQNLTGKALEVSDSQHAVFVIGPPVFVGAIFFSLFVQAVRRQQDEVYE